MNQHTPVDDMAEQSAEQGKDHKTRVWLKVLFCLWVLTLAALVGVGWNAYFNEKEKALTVAQQIKFACESGDFGPGISEEDEAALCSNAKKVVENDPELQDEEIQEAERQDAEVQDPEFQNPEVQDMEIQDLEIQDPELADAEEQELENQEDEIQDEEIQDPEVDDPEIQDEETQDPEINDPDPNDQIESGSCTFDGTGTITFTFETSSGPVTTTCTGTANNEPPTQGAANGK